MRSRSYRSVEAPPGTTDMHLVDKVATGASLAAESVLPMPRIKYWGSPMLNWAMVGWGFQGDIVHAADHALLTWSPLMALTRNRHVLQAFGAFLGVTSTSSGRAPGPVRVWAGPASALAREVCVGCCSRG